MTNEISRSRAFQERGKDILEQAERPGDILVSKSHTIAQILESMPRDVDDRIRYAIQSAREKTKREVQSRMDTEVREKVIQGGSELGKSTEISRDQIGKSNAVNEAIRRIESIGEINPSQISEAYSTIETTKNTFEDIIGNNQNRHQKAEAIFQRQRTEIAQTL